MYLRGLHGKLSMESLSTWWRRVGISGIDNQDDDVITTSKLDFLHILFSTQKGKSLKNGETLLNV